MFCPDFEASRANMESKLVMAVPYGHEKPDMSV